MNLKLSPITRTKHLPKAKSLEEGEITIISWKVNVVITLKLVILSWGTVYLICAGRKSQEYKYWKKQSNLSVHKRKTFWNVRMTCYLWKRNLSYWRKILILFTQKIHSSDKKLFFPHRRVLNLCSFLNFMIGIDVVHFLNNTKLYLL